ncbi:MAG TPA: PBP1A family penicillin-binding protein [Geminicoccaceae bacterium]|nr:PBP1A family penicillin-binding protein [Geminicoccaceae bacterium]
MPRKPVAAAPPGRRTPIAGPPRRGRLRRLLSLVPALVLVGLVAWVGLFLVLAPKLPDTDALFADARQARVTVQADDGSVLAVRGATGQAFVGLDEISPWLVKAVIATEDRRFLEHSGIDFIGIGRALLANLRAGGTVEGGSTITQQLAKNLFLTPERTLRRKLEELMLAVWLEVRLDKGDILTLYLNRVYLGAGAYGAEAAAQRYFAKPAKDLTLAEAALIAGLLKAPSRYAPTTDLDLARSRAAIVLSVMAEQGVIDADQATAARLAPAKLAPEAGMALAGHFVDWVLEGLTDELGKPERDLVVRTTLDPALQRAAEAAVAAQMPAGKAPEAAVVVLDTGGAVRAMVGGRTHRGSPYNRAASAKRQPGSAFKPFVWLAALESGMTPVSTVEDAPVRIGSWQPVNHDRKYHGQVTLTQALALSLNSAAARLGEKVGRQMVIATARKMGVVSPLQPIASLPLGTAEVTPLELTAAYLPFTTGGIRRPPFAVKEVEDARGRALYRYQPTEVRVIDPERARQMDLMLRAVVSEGTGRAAAIPGRSVAGKTGTTQDSRDAWFVGFTGRHLAGVWIGNDDATPMPGVTGGALPARLWQAVMRHTPAAPPLVAEAPPTPRPRPEVRDDNGLELLFYWVERTFGSLTQ